MKLVKIDTDDPRQVKKFINLPKRIYQNNTRYVPTMISEMELVMNKHKHPFYKHSDADFFIVEENGEVVGRVAALKNTNYCKHHDEEVGFFFYFEVIEDQSVSQLLCDAVFNWQLEHGAKRVIGPKGFIRNNSVGLLVEGFEHVPAMGIAYNPTYYATFLELAGFVKETDYYSGYLSKGFRLPAEVHIIAEKVLKQGKFWVKSFNNKKEMQPFIPIINQVHHDAFKNNLGYYPTTEEEFNLMAKSIMAVSDPHMLKAIMKEDKVAGFIIAYPDISRGLQKSGGKVFPFGWIPLLIEKKRTRVVDLNGVGLLPEYQGRGANALLYSELEKSIRPYNFERGEYIQIDERNTKSFSDSQTMGVKFHKIHRLFTKNIQ